MKFIFNYLLEFDFPTSRFLSHFREDMIDMYSNKRRKDALDYPLINTPINEYLNDRIKKLVEDTFYVSPISADIGLSLYVQDNKKDLRGFSYHTHSHTPAALCGIIYLDVPKEGGEFEVFHYPYITQEKPLRIKPQENKIYMFPPWLHHRATPQKDENFRFSLNFSYYSDTRPILKAFSERW